MTYFDRPSNSLASLSGMAAFPQCHVFRLWEFDKELRQYNALARFALISSETLNLVSWSKANL